MARCIEERRRRLREKLRALSFVPLMRGTLVERWRKCGKPTCACARDAERRHGGKYVSVGFGGQTLAVAVRIADEAAITEALRAYRELRAVINELTVVELDILRRAARERRRQRKVAVAS